jgi:hypothetical protein
MMDCDCGMKMLCYNTVVVLYLAFMKKGKMPKRRLRKIYNNNKETIEEIAKEEAEKEAEKAKEEAAKAEPKKE